MLYQYQFLLSPKHSEQILWSRFINTKGVRGHNIPSDQHMEHLNRILKDSIKNLGSNKTEGGFVRVGKAIGTIVAILEQYDQISSIPAVSDAHKTLVSSSDKLVQEFNNTHIFD